MHINISEAGNSSMGPAVSPMVTPHMVRSRTVELAHRAGRSSIQIRQCDYERAKRELTGETNSDRQHQVLYPAL
jgi:hypothetical protein